MEQCDRCKKDIQDDEEAIWVDYCLRLWCMRCYEEGLKENDERCQKE